MSTADLRKIGSIDLLDLDIISRFYGRDFLPYPFMFTQPSRFSWHDEYVEYARSVPDRFNHGDLAIFQECAGSYANADIRVECHVQYIPADTASVRVVAARRDQAGFLAKQRPDEDVIDVYEVSPYLLGPAVADSVALEKPGRRSAIVIPEYAPVSANADAPEDFTIHQTIEGASSAVEVARAEVTAYGTVQTHWRPTRHWGIDPGKSAAVWVRIKHDGDYLYQPDFSEARPMSRPMLAERIDQLISEDVKALRQFRNG
jgi:EspG family